MENFITMLNTQMILLIYLLVGVYARKRRIITPQSRQSLVDLIIRIALPCLIFQSFGQDITLQEAKNASQILLLSFGVCFGSMLLGKLLYRRYPYEKSSILRYGTLITNASFAGMTIISGAYGQKALFYASVFIIPNRIFMWSAGISLFTQADLKTRIKNVVLSPGIIAIALGVLRTITQFHLPPLFDTVIQNIGNCTSPNSMIVIGAILADIDVKSVIVPSVCYLAAVRLLLIPLTVMCIMKALRLDPMLVTVATVMSGMPVGTTTALLAEQYGADSYFGSKCIFLTTALSMVTVPILTLFL